LGKSTQHRFYLVCCIYQSAKRFVDCDSQINSFNEYEEITMKQIRLYGVLIIVLLSLASVSVMAQDVSGTQEPVSSFAPPAEALMPCPMEVTAATVCDVIATQQEDIVGVWSLYFQSQPAFIRFNMDGTWVLGNSLESTSDLASAYASGPYSFDDEGVFTSVFTGAPLDVVPQECQAGRYILRLIKVGGQPVALNHMVIEDCFVNRETDWAYAMLWVSGE
jgi:hypothetical protein